MKTVISALALSVMTCLSWSSIQTGGARKANRSESRRYHDYFKTKA